MRRSAPVLPFVLCAGLAACCRPTCPPPEHATHTRSPGVAPVVRRPEPGKPIAVAGADYEGAIFALGWSPSEEDVRRLEARLPAAWRASLPNARRRLGDYFRQYVGALDSGGARRIEVHGIHRDFLREKSSDPRLDLMPVADGGDSFFEAAYDPTTGRFDHIEFHGEA